MSKSTNIPQNVADAIDAANATEVSPVNLAASLSSYFYDPITYGREQKTWNTHSAGQYAVVTGLLNSLNRRINSKSTSYYTKVNGEHVKKFIGIKAELRHNIQLIKMFERDKYDGDKQRVETKCDQLHSELLLAQQLFNALADVHHANTGKEFKAFDLQETHDGDPDKTADEKTAKKNLSTWEQAAA